MFETSGKPGIKNKNGKPNATKSLIQDCTSKWSVYLINLTFSLKHINRISWIIKNLKMRTKAE